MSENNIEIEPKQTEFTIDLPDVTSQCNRTPAFRKIKKTVTDEQGQEHTVYVKKKIVIGSDQNARVLTWDKWLTYLQNNYQEMTFEQFQNMYEYMTGDAPPQIADSKLKIIKALILWYFPKLTVADVVDKTVQEVNAFLEDKIIDYGEWGLGCPSNCGRFWTFDLAENRQEFKLKNSALISRLGFHKVDGKIVFTCDRCGAQITLS